MDDFDQGDEGEAAQPQQDAVTSEDINESEKGEIIPTLDSGLKPDLLAEFNDLDPSGKDYIEISISDICRAFQISPRFVYQFNLDKDRKVVDTSGDLNTFTLDPRRNRIGAALTANLLTSQDRARGLKIVLPTPEHFGNFNEHATLLSNLVAKGLLTPNEARKRLSLPEHENGNKLFIPAGASESEQDIKDE